MHFSVIDINEMSPSRYKSFNLIIPIFLFLLSKSIADNNLNNPPSTINDSNASTIPPTSDVDTSTMDHLRNASPSPAGKYSYYCDIVIYISSSKPKHKCIYYILNKM